MDFKTRRSREIQESIGNALMQYWDPIQVSDVPEAHDEYNNYIGKVYRLLASNGSIEELVDLLYEIEHEWMGLTPNREGLKNVAIKLRKLNVSL